MTTVVQNYSPTTSNPPALPWLTTHLVPARFNAPGASAHNVVVLNLACNNALTAGRGWEVELPNGVYDVDHLGWQINTGPVRVYGQGYDETQPNDLHWFGTCISVPANQGGTALRVHGVGARGFRLAGIAFRQEVTVPTSGEWRPAFTDKEFAVVIENLYGGFHVEDIFFPSALKGLTVRGTGSGTIGRARISSIKGDCIHRLLEMDRVLDASSIGVIHSWPFSGPVPSIWTEAQGALYTPVMLGRVDGLHIGRLFTFNAVVGLHCKDFGSGVPRFVHVDSLYADFAGVGLYADGNNKLPGGDLVVTVDAMTFQGENFQLGGGVQRADAIPVVLRNNAFVVVNSLHAERFPTHVVVIDQGTANLRLGVLRTQLAGSGNTVTDITAGSVVRLGQSPEILSNHVNWRAGGTGTVTLPVVVSV